MNLRNHAPPTRAAHTLRPLLRPLLWQNKRPPHWAPRRRNCADANKQHKQSLTTPVIEVDAIDDAPNAPTSLPARLSLQLGESLRVNRGDQRDVIGTLREVQTSALVLENELGETVRVERITVEKKHKGKTVSSRSQFPVEVGWAHTVHKMQGKTLRRFVVGCDGFFESGQSYVALSRATDPADMLLLDLNMLKFDCDARVRCFYRGLVAQPLPADTCA